MTDEKRNVYLFNIKDTEIYKIGFTRKKPQLRLEALQTGNPFELLYINHYESDRATKIESYIHRVYAHKKVTEDYESIKGEWFFLSSEDVEGFIKMCKKIDQGLQVIEENSNFTE